MTAIAMLYVLAPRVFLFPYGAQRGSSTVCCDKRHGYRDVAIRGCLFGLRHNEHDLRLGAQRSGGHALRNALLDNPRLAGDGSADVVLEHTRQYRADLPGVDLHEFLRHSSGIVVFCSDSCKENGVRCG